MQWNWLTVNWLQSNNYFCEHPYKNNLTAVKMENKILLQNDHSKIALKFTSSDFSKCFYFIKTTKKNLLQTVMG